MFLLCHTPRIIVDVINIIKREKFVKCKPWLPGKNFKILIEVSEFTLILNSSLNFFVYCLIDETFRKEFHKFYQPQTSNNLHIFVQLRLNTEL